MPHFSASHSAEFVEDRCRAADVRLVSLDRRMLMHEEAVQLSRCAVGSYAFESKTLVEGGAADDAAVVMLILSNESEALFVGERVRANDLIIFGPGATHMAHGGRRRTASIFLRGVDLQRQLSGLLSGSAPDIRGRRFRFRLSEQHARRLHAAFRSPWTEWGGECAESPEPELMAQWESEFISGVCDVVSRAWSPMDAPESRAKREAIVTASRDLIIASRGNIDLTTICERIGYSAETVRLVFREFLGIPPVRYARAHRLHECRRALQAADPRIESIRSVAHSVGITGNLGRFASEYRARFHELPSETLASSDNLPSSG